jgi:membrane-bound lytic murein transglycosylase A
MKALLYYFMLIFIFYGCSKAPKIKLDSMPNTILTQSSFKKLPNWENENYIDLLDNFQNNCRSTKTKKLYKDLCKESRSVYNARDFFEQNFEVFKIESKREDQILTGYYEPQLQGSVIKSDRYKYPIYETPKDLINIDLESIYPELKKYRLRGKLQGSKIVPYFKRADLATQELNTSVICYVDSKIELFFLEVQGSGRVKLDTNETIFVGYDNQNGYKYRSIGKYLVQHGEIALEEISLQSIHKWLNEHPKRIDEILNYNDSLVFFKQRNYKAKGALGLELTPMRSVAVDRRYISLGSMLYLSAKTQAFDNARAVFAQDTGGAIKGAVRADLFIGFGRDAGELAGELKAPLELWIMVPKNNDEEKE